MCMPCRDVPITKGPHGQLLIEMHDILELCCKLPSLNCRVCRRHGTVSTVHRQFTLDSANGLICIVLPKTRDNKLEDVDGRHLELNLQTAVELRVGDLDLDLRVLHICQDGHHYGYFYHATSQTSQVACGWYFYDDMQNRGKALYIGPVLKFWHDPASIECAMYIQN